MKLVILTSRFPYPLEKGDKLRIYHQIRVLSRRYEITLISLAEQPPKDAELAHLRQFCAAIHVFRLSKLRIAFNLISGWLQGLPLQVSYFYHPGIRKKIARLIQQEKPDHLYCQLIRMAPYVSDLPLPKTLDFMDTFSIGMQRRAERSRGLWRWLFRREAKQLQAYEAQAFAAFDHCTIISEQDRDLLVFAGKAQVRIVPNGVDTDFFHPKFKSAPEYHLAFVGNMGYHPNVEAAKFLVGEVLPILQQTVPDVRVLIAGARPTSEVLALQSAQVTVTGWVEDIRDAYGSARVFVAPIFLGSGQQNKILEAMSMALPCVTTGMVNNAIHAPVNSTIFVADTAANFAANILKILADENLQTTIGQAARDFVEQKYGWEHSVRIFAELFEKRNSNHE